MSETRYTTTIARPVEEVFAFINDMEAAERWVGVLKETELLSEQNDGGVGTRFRHVYEQGGRRFEMVGEVIAYEANRRVAIHLSGDAFDLDAEYRFEPVPGGTQVTQISEVQPNSFFQKVMFFFMGPFMRKSTRQQLEEDFGRLKGILENSSGETS